MFRKRKNKKKLMAFDRSPRLSGKVNVCFGLPLLALWLLRCYRIDCWANGTTILSYIILAYIIGSGVYRWAFRRGAVNDTVTLGGFANRMYLRYGWLYVPLGFVADIAGFVAIVMLITWIDNDFKAVPMGDCGDFATSFAWFLLMLMYNVTSSYVNFYEYYRSPEASRKEMQY